MTERTVDLPEVEGGEAELRRWLVAPGERVGADDPLARVAVAGSVVLPRSPREGVVTDRHVALGETVGSGDRLVTVDTDAGDASDASDPGGPRRVFAPPRTRRLARELGVDIAAVEGSGPSGRVTDADVRAAAERSVGDLTAGGPGMTARIDAAETGGTGRPAPREMDADATSVLERRQAGRFERVDPGGGERDGDPAEAGASAPAEAGVVDVDPAGEGPPTPTDDGPSRDRTLAAPATQRLADDLGVDIDAVPTDRARDGVPFVTPSMVHEYAGRRRERTGAGSGDDAAAGTTDDEAAGTTDDEAAGKTTERDPPASGERPPDGSDPRPGDRIPYRGLRRTVGERLERSATLPQVTHTDEADVTALVERRAELADRADREGVRLTYLPFVLRAVALALADHPTLNASLDADGEEIILHDEYHLGVATGTGAGLLVPVVEDVDERGLFDIAAAVERKVERARDRSIDIEEMRGGTFTVTNLGAVGGRYATPIVDPPEVAILALGRIEKRPRVVDGEVVPRHTLPLSLSVDHRVVDGAAAARFTNRVLELLATPERLSLDR